MDSNIFRLTKYIMVRQKGTESWNSLAVLSLHLGADRKEAGLRTLKAHI